jgi:acetyl-CoA carboxylase carboxyl transferase subunit beta
MDIPKGLCTNLQLEIIDADELAHLFVSPEDGFHVRRSTRIFQILFDNNEFVELDKNMTSKDPLHLWTQKNMQID